MTGLRADAGKDRIEGADKADGPAEDNRSLFSDMATLLADGRTFAEAEIAYQKARLGYAGKRGLRIAICGALALVCVIFALFALIIGVILGLAPYLTVWGSSAAVVIALLLTALVCLVIARHNARRISAAFRDEPEA